MQPEFEKSGHDRNSALLEQLSELTRDGQPAFGAKAVNLARMRAAGLPVPDGFCISTTAYRHWLAGCVGADSLLERLDALSVSDPERARRTATQLREQLALTPMPAAVGAGILEHLNRREPGQAWAVRSSATAEDLPGASFAGQHDTQLNVRGPDAVLAAVRQCWVSLFTERAVLYRLKNRVSHRAAAMAVIVQEMVNATAAGVAFTADPMSGDRERIIIEGVPGLGEALVSGKVNPDRFVLGRATLRLASPTVSTRFRPAESASAAGEVEQQVDVGRRTGPCFSEAQARQLAELALDAERLLGGAQDVEWAIDRKGFYLLQARPVTALPAAEDSDPEIWSNANAIEAMPGVVTPMSWTVMQGILDEFLNPLIGRLGVRLSDQPLVKLIAGRAYLNVGTFVRIARRFATAGPVDFAAAFGGNYDLVKDVFAPAPGKHRIREAWRRFRLIFRVALWLLPHLPRQRRLVEEWCERMHGDLAQVDVASLADGQLVDHMRAWLQLATRGATGSTGAGAVWMAVGGVGGATMVFNLARRWLGDQDGNLANRLIAGASGMNSADNGLALVRLSAWARERPPLAEALLRAGPFAEVERRLAAVPDGPEFLDRWRAFMDRHGHQARGGMDPYSPRWSEMPDYVLATLRDYLTLSADADPLAFQARRLRERQDLLADCRRRLRNPVKRGIFSALVRVTQRGLAQRENVKNEGVRVVAVIRRVLHEAGRRLVQRGVFDDRDDVFFLEVHELDKLLAGRADLDVASILARRKADHAWNAALNPPPVVIGGYDPARSGPVVPGPDGKVLRGLGVSPGVVTGKARVILQADSTERVLPGEILVAPYTDPGWTPCFLSAAGIVVDVGGLLSHGSVVAREYGIPAVVNVGAATRTIQTGQLIRVDGKGAEVTILDSVAPNASGAQPST